MAGELSADGTAGTAPPRWPPNAHYTVRVSTEDEDGAPGRKVLDLRHQQAHHQEAPEGHLRPQGGHVRRRPAHHGRTDPARQGQGASGPSSSAPSRSTPRPPCTAPGTGWTTRNSTTAPRSYWPAHATIQVRSNLERHQDRRPALGRQGQAPEPHHRRPAHRRHGRLVPLDDGLQERRGHQRSPSPPASPASRPATASRSSWARSTSYVCAAPASASPRASDSYDLPVYYATRVTWSGEYVHAAPWSVGSQGYANVSHGCTGMSTENAEWFFDTVREGDVVKVVNSDGDTMDPSATASATGTSTGRTGARAARSVGGTPDGPAPAEQARLRPQSV